MRNKIKKQNKLIMISIICMTLLFSIGYAAFSTNIVLKGKGNIKEKSRIIQSWWEGLTTDFHNSEYKENIVSVSFLDTAKVPSSAVESWDVSAAKDKGVMAYVKINEEDNTKYDLFIGAKDGVVANQNSNYLFSGFKSLKTITFGKNFNTSNTTAMAYMFAQCTSLINIDINNLNTSKVRSMYGMFNHNDSIKTINFQNFDTSSVEDMREMFSSSPNLEELDLTSFNTSSTKYMSSMFYGCTNLKSLNVSSFNTSNVTLMPGMFQGCRNLKELNVQNFNTSNVVNMRYMFSSCTSITSLNLCSFNTNAATDISGMFNNTQKINTIYVGSGWNTANADTTNMFAGSNIASVTVGYCN